MPNVLRTNIGSTGREYDICLGKDGVVYCTCWPWKKNRTCKHLDEYHASVGTNGTHTVQTIQVQHPVADEVDPVHQDDLADMVDNVIDELKGNK
jgi:hypothetical protein